MVTMTLLPDEALSAAVIVSFSNETAEDVMSHTGRKYYPRVGFFSTGALEALDLYVKDSLWMYSSQASIVSHIAYFRPVNVIS